MLTYQILPKTAIPCAGELPLSFPANVVVSLELGPTFLFEPKQNWPEEEREACRVFRAGKGTTEICINAATGRVSVVGSALDMAVEEITFDNGREVTARSCPPHWRHIYPQCLRHHRSSHRVPQFPAATCCSREVIRRQNFCQAT